MSAPRMVAVATILVVDDEPRIVQLVRDYLEHGGFTVLTAVDGPTALRTARTGRPDLVVLDLGLPGLDGLDVARSLRREGEMPIIMLTARSEASRSSRTSARSMPTSRTSGRRSGSSTSRRCSASATASLNRPKNEPRPRLGTTARPPPAVVARRRTVSA